MKKAMAFFAVLCMLLLCTACTPKDDGTVFSGGSGTEADPYRIATAEDLWEMAEKMNTREIVEDYTMAHYRLTADIDLGGRKEWIPIGYYSKNTDHYRFEGVLDGAGHTISGIRIQYEEPRVGQKRSLFGLIGKLEGTVKNLTIDDSSIRAEGEISIYAGAIAGSVDGGNVENCHTTDCVEVFSSYYSGGICGRLDGKSTISGCSNGASVTAESIVGEAGGIAAYVSCPVTDCANVGSVISSLSRAAGIVVTATAGLRDCVNAGSITAEDDAAGIVCSFGDGALNPGMNDDTISLLRCINSGSVTSAGGPTGGIAAGCRSGSVVDCINSGRITSPKETGGIFAYFQPSAFGTPCEEFLVSGCANSGTVSSADDFAAGGICGMIYGGTTRLVFENCENSGIVEAGGRTNVIVSGAQAGGIVGEAIVSALEIRNCRNTGAVRGFAVCGGILGEAKPERDVQETTLLVADCVNSGSVYVVNPGGLTTELYAGGMVAKCPLAEITDELLPMFTDLRIEDCRNTGTLDGDREGGTLCRDDLCGSWQSSLE